MKWMAEDDSRRHVLYSISLGTSHSLSPDIYGIYVGTNNLSYHKHTLYISIIIIIFTLYQVSIYMYEP